MKQTLGTVFFTVKKGIVLDGLPSNGNFNQVYCMNFSLADLKWQV
jgi:hypothetical protein